MKMENDGLNFDEEDDEIKQFRNSIYNFNRLGVSKDKIRAKIFKKPPESGQTTDRRDDAQKRYEENLKEVRDFIQ